MAITKCYSNKKGTHSAHYDTSGNKVLYSHRGTNGRVKHYDGNGKYLGSTREGGYGRVHHYDKNGRRAGTSYINPSGSIRHYPANNRSDSAENQTDKSYAGSSGVTHRNNMNYGNSGANFQGTPGNGRRKVWTQADDAIGCLAIIAAFIILIFLIT